MWLNRVPEDTPLPRPGSIHVWRIRLDYNRPPAADAGALLSETERLRAERFHFSRDQVRYKVGHAILRILLGSYLRIEPHLIKFESAPKGKPFVAGTPLRFNMSDSGCVCLFALSLGTEIGVDVEKIRSNVDYRMIAEREFPSLERNTLAQLDAEKRLLGFFDLWTAKEAFLKAKGLGLTVPLDAFSIQTVQGRNVKPRLVSSDLDPEDVGRWSLHWLQVGPEYAGCLAAEGNSTEVETFDWTSHGF